jgi:hypothetical protein
VCDHPEWLPRGKAPDTVMSLGRPGAWIVVGRKGLSGIPNGNRRHARLGSGR